MVVGVASGVASAPTERRPAQLALERGHQLAGAHEQRSFGARHGPPVEDPGAGGVLGDPAEVDDVPELALDHLRGGLRLPLVLAPHDEAEPRPAPVAGLRIGTMPRSRARAV